MQVQSTRRQRPRKLMVYGLEGIGKSTFASRAPAPVFLPTEEGLDNLDVQAFPLSRTWADVLRYLNEVYSDEHTFQTLVIDSLDWLEELIFKEVCQEKKVTNIAEIGYGVGYARALDYWQEFLTGLSAIRDKRSMQIILLAHCRIEKFEAPDTANYDRYAPKLNKHGSSLVREWCDEVLFACFDKFTKVEKGGFGKEKVRVMSSGNRILQTVERPFAMAKNRCGMPEEIPFTWEDYAKWAYPTQLHADLNNQPKEVLS